METLEFRVPGMTCAHCVAAVKSEVAEVPGVTSVTVDLETKAVVVEGDTIDRELVWAAVDEAGFEAAP